MEPKAYEQSYTNVKLAIAKNFLGKTFRPGLLTQVQSLRRSFLLLKGQGLLPSWFDAYSQWRS